MYTITPRETALLSDDAERNSTRERNSPVSREHRSKIHLHTRKIDCLIFLKACQEPSLNIIEHFPPATHIRRNLLYKLCIILASLFPALRMGYSRSVQLFLKHAARFSLAVLLNFQR